MSEDLKQLTDPDAWYLPAKSKDHIIWIEEHGQKELWDDIIYNFVEELGKELRRKQS